jgi:hypothetical protein
VDHFHTNLIARACLLALIVPSAVSAQWRINASGSSEIDAMRFDLPEQAHEFLRDYRINELASTHSYVSEIKDIVILALDKREMIFPFHVDGFQVANGNRGKIKKQYRNATVFFHDGTTQKINDVVIKGAWGKSFLGKVFSFLNSSWRVEIVSEKIDMELQEQKKHDRK